LTQKKYNRIFDINKKDVKMDKALQTMINNMPEKQANR
jgi:hypothetical protein